MMAPESRTPIGDRLRLVYEGDYGRGLIHQPWCADLHVLCAYQAGRAEALRQLAADLEDEARSITGQDEPPWASMYGLKVTSGAEAAVILRRAAELARRRADDQTAAVVTRG